MLRIISFAALLCISLSTYSDNKSCSYTTYKWNSHQRKAVEFRQINKPYSEITREEQDPLTSCTVCSEDQVTLSVNGLAPFKICKLVAAQIDFALTQALNSGQDIVQIQAYRVGKTRGDLDQFGNRTQFSNHSFGTAIDVNSNYNGLYDNCLEFNPSCRLIKGGKWRKDHPLSITKDSPLVTEMNATGFQWGGLIKGKQKDFMHFSLTGY